MRGGGSWKNFYRFRDADANVPYRATYGDRIDQLCHLPYESGLLPAGDKFAKEISDWWTNGSNDSPKMTYPPANPQDWKFYGTHWKHFFNPTTNEQKKDNDRLYPGPSLQLAKLEWRTGKARDNRVLIERANNRYRFVNSSDHSDLWVDADNVSDAGVPNGIIDWRSASQFNDTASKHLRFVDTSSYMMQVTLMVFFDIDTVYPPQ